MASVFTFDPDPPRVSSPWLTPEEPGRKSSRNRASFNKSTVQEELLSEYGVAKLEAEPQDGPTEYKLHLLLRPRRQYTAMSTAFRISGSATRQSNEHRHPKAPAPVLASSNQTRQVRLQQLTTQLLWRLQQSSPYHASTSKDIVIPKLPDDNVDLTKPLKPEKLLTGLEESRGALYEIGVADDGAFVGLAKDEMDESINTLKIMAASLGCKVEIVRMVSVGECEWVESSELIDNADSAPVGELRKDKLWVAEALVTPDVGLIDNQGAAEDKNCTHTGDRSEAANQIAAPSRGQSTTDQLRVTLTGPTTSGKSTLLGTLSTGTLDNGRGMSRLSLLKHQHEVASGLTSSVSQELIGYKDNVIFNYSQGNIESWVDIHDCSENGRLVFVSDSAGHPRYRRTILRGLVGWAPHWTVLCLAADDAEASSVGDGATSFVQDVLGASCAGIDLAKAHLDLCLKLDTPLAVVITKLDLANKSSLHRLLGRVLTRVKEVGRVPEILKPDQKPHSELTQVPVEDVDKVKKLVGMMTETGNLLHYVPIILTSAVKGIGIGLTHALLQNLPLPPPPTSHDFFGLALNPEQPACLFHVDDKYSLPAAYASLATKAHCQGDMGTVVSGYLRFGRLSVGDRVVVGPFRAEDESPRGLTPDERLSPGSHVLSTSHPFSAELARIAARKAVSASKIKGQWHHAHIVSIRNLRLPVLTLEAGQVGTIGLVLDVPEEDSVDDLFDREMQEAPRIRKGMVLAVPTKHMNDTGVSLQAASGLTATFDDPEASTLAVGSLVNVYIASIRAAARIRRVTLGQVHEDPSNTATEDIDDIFNLNEQLESNGSGEQGSSVAGVMVSLELLTHREWVELGSRIIMLEGASKDRSGLEGFVGKVIEIFD